MALVRNAWYVAAYGSEIGAAPLARTILDDPIVMFRQPNGRVSALLDICPHRFSPLSRGIVTDGILQCAYHGLEFDGAGTCVRNPHGNGAIARALAARAFPVVERDSLIWLWPGTPALADESRIPEYRCLVDPGRTTVSGHGRVVSNYRLLVDNLLDLGHARYLHRQQFPSSVFTESKREVKVVGDVVYADLMLPGGTDHFHKPLLDPSDPVLKSERFDSWLDVRWNPVGSILTCIASAPQGVPKEQSVSSMSAHALTPETEASFHYFFANSRNFRQDDAEVDGLFRRWQQQALMGEDGEMVAAIEARAPAIRRHKMTPTMLSCDEAAARVSRMIDEMADAEAAGFE